MPGASGTITYDASGNTTRLNNRIQNYDSFGQMTSSAPATGYTGNTVTYSYDVLGRKASESDSATQTTRYFDYDGDDLIAEQSGATVADSTYTSYWGDGSGGYVGAYGGSAGVGTSGGQVYQYSPDGEMWGLAATPGSWLWNLRNSQDAFGNVQEGAGYTAPPSPFRFDGAYTDPSTGLMSNPSNGMGGAYNSAAGDDLVAGLENEGSLAGLYAEAGKRGWGNLKKLPSWQPGSPERRFESQVAGLIPGVGQALSIYKISTGKDAISGDCLSVGDRIIEGLFLGVSGALHLSPGESGGASNLPHSLHIATPLTVEDAEMAYAAAAKSYKSSALSVAAQSLDKHSPLNPSRSGGLFPIPTGSPAAKNALAQDVIGSILGNRLSVRINKGAVFDIVSPSGRGIRFHVNGSWKGFVEFPP